MADESGNASFPGNRVRSDNGAAAFGSAPGINVKVSYRGKLAKWTADGKVEIPARAKSSASGAWWKKQGDYLRSMVALPVGWGQDYSAPWAAKRGAKTAEQGKATADRLRNMVPAGSGV